MSAVVVHAVPLGIGGADSGQEPATRRVRIYKHVISTTLQPHFVVVKNAEDAEPAGSNKRSKGKGTAAEELARAKRTAAATAVINDFKGGRLRAWHAEGYIEAAIVPLEYGESMGAHLQAGWVVTTEVEDAKKAISELTEKRIRPVLRLHSEESKEGKIKWTIREAHIHPNYKKLFGYAFKVRRSSNRAARA